jgi:hypothetical protein
MEIVFPAGFKEVSGNNGTNLKLRDDNSYSARYSTIAKKFKKRIFFGIKHED